MTASIPSARIQPDSALKARFAAEVGPLIDVLSRGARRLARTDADAEDLLQDTLMRAFVGFGSFEEGTNLKAWLFCIQHNQWINDHRRRQRRPAEVSLDVLTDREVANHDTHARTAVPSAEREVLESLPDSGIRAAMEQLSEGSRTVLYYADVEGCTYSETAARMNIPIGTVMSRASRARSQLRRALQGMAATTPAA